VYPIAVDIYCIYRFIVLKLIIQEIKYDDQVKKRVFLNIIKCTLNRLAL